MVLPNLPELGPGVTWYHLYEYHETADQYEYARSYSLIAALSKFNADIIRDGSGIYSARDGYILIIRQDITLEQALKWYEEQLRSL